MLCLKVSMSMTLTDVSKSYFNQARVLDRVNLTLARGDFLYVVGGSGAGKSTLLRLMNTQETPSSGQIKLFGYDLATASSLTLRAIRQSVGYIPQNVGLIPDLTVVDNVALSLSLSGLRLASVEAKARLSELLNRLGLDAKRKTLAKHLSGGEAQRVAVARALVRDPEFVIADEPTGAQDRDHTWLLMDLFLKANVKKATLVVATHDREIVRRVRKRCAILKRGHLAFEEVLCSY